ncbi:MAG: glycosyltransferase family 4 protein [Alphaproteobacteria bacterium]|jgi:glycosyltransferase involved in cell wall biosynthesis|nr:glycosyltransferase family 4 protein [Alphaproteobacteria bacterium]
MSEARRVLQVLPAMGAGGVPRGTIEVAAAQVAAGWRALVASAGGPGVAALEAVGAEHIALPLESKNPFAIAANGRRLEALIRQSGIDLIHARSRAPAWSALLAARGADIPFVTTFHGTYGHANAVKRRYNSVMTEGDRVIAISEHISRHMQAVYGTPAERIRVIPRGVDLAEFDAAKVAPERIAALRRDWGADEAPVVLLPGRLTAWKGQSVLVEAARLAQTPMRIVLAGDAQGRERYVARLRAQISEAGLDDAVIMPGNVADMAAACRAADVVVSASTDPEAFGRVAIEGQAMGRPVIASAHGGSQESVVDGETGWLVPPGDATALAAALDHCLSLSRDARTAMGDAGIARVREHFTKDTMCAATLAVYSELLENNR